jgi:hypothetical protein
VPIPRFLAELLADHLVGKPPDDLAFTAPVAGCSESATPGEPGFDPGRFAPPAYQLVSTTSCVTPQRAWPCPGANVKAIQRMLGHAKASMTLDMYADLFDDDLEAVADRLDEVARRPDSLRTGDVIAMPEARPTRP